MDKDFSNTSSSTSFYLPPRSVILRLREIYALLVVAVPSSVLLDLAPPAGDGAVGRSWP